VRPAAGAHRPAVAQQFLGDPVGQQLPGEVGVGDAVPHRRERPLGEFPLRAQQPAPVRLRGIALAAAAAVDLQGDPAADWGGGVECLARANRVTRARW
jgi:hypothetical protein